MMNRAPLVYRRAFFATASQLVVSTPTQVPFRTERLFLQNPNNTCFPQLQRATLPQSHLHCSKCCVATVQIQQKSRDGTLQLMEREEGSPETASSLSAPRSRDGMPSVAEGRTPFPNIDSLSFKQPSKMSHVEIAMELQSQGVEKEAIHKWTCEEARAQLVKLYQGHERDYTTEEVEDMLKAASTTRALLKLEDQHQVRDPFGTLKTDESRRDRIRCHLLKHNTNVEKFAELLADVQEEAQKFRTACCLLKNIGQELERFINDEVARDSRLKYYMDRDLPRCREQTQETLSLLQEAECPIVITGEVSTGKSSFLNLLIEGEGIELPHRENETTSCICEIKYGPTPRARVHRYRPQQGESPTEDVEDLTTSKLDQWVNFDNVVQRGKVPYSKVEIFMPVDILKSGIVLVDTPGVQSDTEGMTKLVEDYLHRSVGFVYIVTNAIDVHNLCRLFQIEATVAGEKGSFDDSLDRLTAGMTRRTLFIANKWDQVQQKDAVMKEIHNKLRKHWLTPDKDTQESTACPEDMHTEQSGTHVPETDEPELEAQCKSSESRQSSVAPLSAIADRDHFRAGYITDRTQNVVDQLQRIASNSMKLQLRKHFRLFQLICSRVEYHTQRYLRIAELIDKGESSRVYQEAMANFKKVTELGKQIRKDLKQFVEQVSTIDIAQELCKHLQLPQVRSRIITWTADECPGSAGSFNVIVKSAMAKVQERIRHEIEKWENENHKFALKNKEVAHTVEQFLKQLKTDITWITRALTPALEISTPGFQFRYRFRPLDMIWEIISVLRIPPLLPLQLCMEDLRCLADKRSYMAHPAKWMADMTETALENFKNEKAVNVIVRQSIGLNRILPTFSDQLEQAITNAMSEVKDVQLKKSASEFCSKYTPVQKQCMEIYDKLLHWELDHLFEGHQLDSVSVGDHVFGSGKMATYYRGAIERNEVNEQVTVKRYRKEVNVRSIIQDYKWLKHHCTNCISIARVLGMVQLKLPTGGNELAVVLELCLCSLASWLTEEHLGMWGCSTFDLAQIAYEICQGLSALHQEDLVHGDLSPSTVMFTSAAACAAAHAPNKVKLYHSGVTKGKAITEFDGSLATTKYTPPDLPYQKKYHPAMDVYSVGGILHDLWFGTERSFSEPLPLERDPGEIHCNPPAGYTELMTRCRHSKFTERPAITEVLATLSQMTRPAAGASCT